MKRLYTLLFFLPTLLLSAQEDCIDPSLINPDAICFDIFQPVCGCDGETYSNECYAVNSGGVTSWTEGECPIFAPGDCPELDPGLDFGMCAAIIGVALINNECIAVSGCGTIASDGVNYSAYFYEDLADCQACLQSDCINPDQIDPDAICIEIYDPVCGCDDVTYDNECYAFYYGGVTSWTQGECAGQPTEPAEPCTDLEDIDFGLCDMFLGYGVLAGACEPISGCGWEVEGVDYTPALYDSPEECEACLETNDCINPEQIDLDAPCPLNDDPVCGCDGITYVNECHAYYYGGVTSWFAGTCEEPNPCAPLPSGLDFGECDAVIGVAIVNNACMSISGCDMIADNGVDYSAYFFDTFAECDESCFAVDCINPDQIDPEIMCLDIWDPVCGCDGETYSNDCYAFYFGGVTSWTPGECLPTSVEEADKNHLVIEPRPDFTVRVQNGQLIERFDVFDLTGKHILSRESLAPGEYFFQLPVRYAGLYIIRAQGSNEVLSQKVLLH